MKINKRTLLSIEGKAERITDAMKRGDGFPYIDDIIGSYNGYIENLEFFTDILKDNVTVVHDLMDKFSRLFIALSCLIDELWKPKDWNDDKPHLHDHKKEAAHIRACNCILLVLYRLYV